ncbi:MAG: hypothetical protein HOI95_14585 [Chromatiales bacterium]|nr:hypothetical protein [Chromatiales bacterium]
MENASEPLHTINSVITEPTHGVRYLLIRPLVVLRDSVEHLYHMILRMMIAELKGQSHHYSSLQHAVGFALACTFGLAFFYLDVVEGAAVAIFFVLWGLDRFAHIHVGSWRQDRVLTQVGPRNITWRKSRKSTIIENASIPTNSVRAIEVSAELLVAGAFGRLGHLVWRVYLVADNAAVPIAESEGVNGALKNAMLIGRSINVPVHVRDSIGRSELATTQPSVMPGNVGRWQIEREDGALTATRKLSVWRALRATFEENGILIFVVIMADFLSRFGHLVAVLAGPKFGVYDVPPLYMDLSPSGLASVLMPDWHWLNITELSIATLLLLSGFWGHLRTDHLHLDPLRMDFRRSRKADQKFSTKTSKLDVLRLDTPQPGLLFCDNDGRAIFVDGLDESSVQELYFQSDSWLSAKQ